MECGVKFTVYAHVFNFARDSGLYFTGMDDKCLELTAMPCGLQCSRDSDLANLRRKYHPSSALLCLPDSINQKEQKDSH